QFAAAAFEVDEVGGAPQAEVGVVGFAGAVDAAAHDGDGDRVVLRVGGHLLHLLREFDEGFVLDARAARATDDVDRIAIELHHAADTARGDVGEDAFARGDFFRLARVGN